MVPTNRKLANCNALNVQQLLEDLELQPDLELDQQLIVRNVAQPVNSWIRKQDCVAHADMDSINHVKVHSLANFAVWDRLPGQQKLPLDLNVATNASLECSWALMVNANHVHEELIEPKVCNQHVKLARWDAQHLRLELHQ